MTDTTYQINRRMVTPLAHVNIPVMRYRLESFLPAIVRALAKAKNPELEAMFQPWEIDQVIAKQPFDYHHDHLQALLSYLKNSLATKQTILSEFSPFDSIFADVNKSMYSIKSSIEMITHILYRDKALRKEDAFYPIEGAAFIYGLEGVSVLQIPLLVPADLPGYASLLMLSDPTRDMEKELEANTEETIIERFISKVINTGGHIRFISN